MTTIYEDILACGVCGLKSIHEMLGSFSTAGAQDLDLRESSLGYDPIRFMIQHCPFCGYCSRDLSEGDEELRDIVEGAEYTEQIEDADFPERANWYLCSALIQEKTGKIAEAVWDSIHAAWSCDDAGKEEQAEACRVRASELINQLGEEESFTADELTDLCVQADLLRRSGKFKPALDLVEEGLIRSNDEDIAQVLLFQEKLIKARDAGRHGMGEVPG
jgi:hypothetical protein